MDNSTRRQIAAGCIGFIFGIGLAAVPFWADRAMSDAMARMEAEGPSHQDVSILRTATFVHGASFTALIIAPPVALAAAIALYVTPRRQSMPEPHPAPDGGGP